MKKIILGLFLGAAVTTFAATTLDLTAERAAWVSVRDIALVRIAAIDGLTPVTPPPVTPPPVTPPPVTPPPSTGNEIVMTRAYITGYSYFDNTPPGSADIALPVIHQVAAGTGTYTDPITMAVGHSITNGKSTPDYPKGTKFYLPYLHRYFIVEDVCGDGNTPQNGPCHNLSTADEGATTWLDIWIDGRSGTRSSTDACMEDITALHTAIQNPQPNYVTVTGSVYQGSCSPLFSETPTKL